MYSNIKNLHDACKETNKTGTGEQKNRARLRSHVHALAVKMSQRNPTPRLPARLLSLNPRRLVLDFDLRKLPPDRCHDRRVFRLSAGASQRVAGVGGVFDRIAPGFRKNKIAFRQIFPFRVGKFCHSYPSGLSNCGLAPVLSGRMARVRRKLHCGAKSASGRSIEPSVLYSLSSFSRT